MEALIIVDVKAMQVNKPFTYHVPFEMEDVILTGSRVLVPFGNRTVLGFVVGVGDYLTDYELKDITSLVDLVPILNQEMLDLASYIAKETSSFLITVFKAMIPSSLSFKYTKTLLRVKPSVLDSYFDKEEIPYENIKKLRILQSEIKKGNIEVLYHAISQEKIKEDSILHLEHYDFLPYAKQQEILDYMLSVKGDVVKKEITDQFSVSSLKSLLEKGLISEYKQEKYREISSLIPVEYKDISLNEEQKNCYDRIYESLNEFKTFLLFGVTGSGKTEVYLNLISDVLAQGKSAIFLVPEISLTPQMASRVKARFKEIALFHSGMSNNEKYDEWRKIFRNEARVIVGARSAIFAPIKNIGIIIIDEEHEHTYKQDTNPRYNALDVAKKRAEYHSCPLILGSATPSIISYYKALNGEYVLLKIMERANHSSLPKMHIINMSEELKYGNKSMFSNTLANLISDRLAKKEQIILLMNKRGYSSFVMCRSCGEVIKCPNCDVTLTYHKNSDNLVCHYCGYKTSNVTKCPKCESGLIKPVGVGTEQVEETLNKMFKARVLRMDTDTTSKKGAHEEILYKFMKNEADILVGTQMISKGLDFKNVTLVGIMMADITLKLPDYRNSEKTYQLIMQVAGRAGRHQNEGDVVVQSYNTEHYSITKTKENDYDSFYQKEIEIRRQASYPPFVFLSQIVVEEEDMNKAFKIANRLVNRIKELLPNAIIMGPAIASIARVKNKFRVQIMIKNKEPNLALFQIIKENQDVMIYIDHDPILI